MSQPPTFSRNGKLWWDGQQWLPLSQKTSGINWRLTGILLGIVGVVAFIAFIVSGLNSIHESHRDFDRLYCQTYPDSQGC